MFLLIESADESLQRKIPFVFADTQHPQTLSIKMTMWTMRLFLEIHGDPTVTNNRLV